MGRHTIREPVSGKRSKILREMVAKSLRGTRDCGDSAANSPAPRRIWVFLYMKSDVTWQRSLLPFSDCSAPILREGLLLSSNQALLELPTPCALCSPKSGRCDHRGPSSIQFGEYLGRESAPGRQGGPQCHERPSKSPPFWGCGGGCALMRALVDCTRGHVFRAWVYYASLHLYRD